MRNRFRALGASASIVALCAALSACAGASREASQAIEHATSTEALAQVDIISIRLGEAASCTDAFVARAALRTPASRINMLSPAAAVAQIASSSSLLMPSVAFDAAGGISDNGGETRRGRHLQIAPTFNFPIFQNGGPEAAGNSAKYSTAQQVYLAQVVAQHQVLAAIKAAAEIQRTMPLIDAAKAELDAAKHSLDVAKHNAQTHVGLANATDVTTAEAAYDLDVERLQLAERDHRDALDAYHTATGL